MTTQLEVFDKRFLELHERSFDLVRKNSDDQLFRKPRPQERLHSPFSIGEYIIRSASIVEQTFGGITTRLWDDPFEWTLPEKLSTTEKVCEYLTEVEVTRRKGFDSFVSDSDLSKMIPAPERLRPIFAIILETLCRAAHFQGRAFSIFQMFSDEKMPRI